MNTRSKILNILSRSKKSLGPKIIASELKKTSANIRKILSNLYKEGKIEKAGYGKYISSVNVKNISVNVDDSEAKKLINEEKNKYLKNWRARNPNYNKTWLKAYYKKYPERVKKYQNRYWLKKALSGGIGNAKKAL